MPQTWPHWSTPSQESRTSHSQQC